MNLFISSLALCRCQVMEVSLISHKPLPIFLLGRSEISLKFCSRLIPEFKLKSNLGYKNKSGWGMATRNNWCYVYHIQNFQQLAVVYEIEISLNKMYQHVKCIFCIIYQLSVRFLLCPANSINLQDTLSFSLYFANSVP